MIRMAAPYLKIAIVGDVMLGRLIDQIFPTHNIDMKEYDYAELILSRYPKKQKELQQKKYQYVWGNILPAFLQSDVRMINLETAVTTHEKKWPHKAFNYRMHPDNLQSLVEAKIDYCSLANNHILDYCEEGMYETMKSLKSRNILFAGVGENIEKASEPCFLTVKERKFAFFSFADHYDFWAAQTNKPGINYINVQNYQSDDIQKIKALTNKAHQNGAEFITVSIHWGSNYCWNPPKSFQNFAHQLIDDCGVDLIHGHSSHHIQVFHYFF